MTNPFQNFSTRPSVEFNDAMACVLRGGKAWRATWTSKIRLMGRDGCLYRELAPTGFNKRSDGHYQYDLIVADLTATDWVWSEPESKEESS